MSSDATSFALAQQRLAARRVARQNAEAVRLAAQNSGSQLRARIASSASSSSSSPLVRRLGSSTLAAWDAFTGREGTRPALRVGQVDAELLDEELVSLLRGQVRDALRYLTGGRGGDGGGRTGNVVDDWGPEMLLALRAILFKLTLWDHDATYGAALQNLKYTDARRDSSVPSPPTRWQKSLYGLATVGGRYLWTKWENWLVEHDDGMGIDQPPNMPIQHLSRVTSAVSTVHATAAFVSFLAFLLHGRYRTLIDRILRIRLAPPTSQVSREVSFEYLNRQLVWHAFTEFLLFVLPLLGINRWRRWLSRAWRRTKEIVIKTTAADADGQTKQAGELAFLPERTCTICYQDQNSAKSEAEMLAAAASASSGGVVSARTDITNPYEAMPCGCVYCFVCLATRLEREEGEGWTCLRCGALTKECKPWGGDVLEPPTSRPARVKTVGFADDVKDTASDSASHDVAGSIEDTDGSNVWLEKARWMGGEEEDTKGRAGDVRDARDRNGDSDSEDYQKTLQR